MSCAFKDSYFLGCNERCASVKWGETSIYAVRSGYKMLCASQELDVDSKQAFTQLWQQECPIRCQQRIKDFLYLHMGFVVLLKQVGSRSSLVTSCRPIVKINVDSSFLASNGECIRCGSTGFFARSVSHIRENIKEFECAISICPRNTNKAAHALATIGIKETLTSSGSKELLRPSLWQLQTIADW
ncbi:hypothetical protein F3Y22_tig00113719pilonHSYRG00112 [Hibiscus syriacus]|uniref:Uncharacterized protein n=1 Tax=Hibiscus syriacus TaxID=106335 RepID=A0A6A2WNU1_HIBSY|nr:hypothetical protein F3Y22_tig00113719pilonHSYRG00112 [Hibiscus syriacus]